MVIPKLKISAYEHQTKNVSVSTKIAPLLQRHIDRNLNVLGCDNRSDFFRSLIEHFFNGDLLLISEVEHFVKQKTSALNHTSNTMQENAAPKTEENHVSRLETQENVRETFGKPLVNQTFTEGKPQTFTEENVNQETLQGVNEGFVALQQSVAYTEPLTVQKPLQTVTETPEIATDFEPKPVYYTESQVQQFSQKYDRLVKEKSTQDEALIELTRERNGWKKEAEKFKTQLYEKPPIPEGAKVLSGEQIEELEKRQKHLAKRNRQLATLLENEQAAGVEFINHLVSTLAAKKIELDGSELTDTLNYFRENVTVKDGQAGNNQ